MSLNLADIHKRVMPILSQAKKMLLNAYYGESKYIDLKIRNDISSALTKIDQLIEKFLITELKKEFPEYGFISEEEVYPLKKDFNWVIDPIDGTLNFSRKIPLFGISIALWNKNEPMYGIISLPMLNICLNALKNQGSFYNNKKIKYQKPKKLDLPYILHEQVGKKEEFLKVFTQITKIYTIPAIPYCTTFSGVMAILGRVDCSVIINLALWDIAALVIIAQETGVAMKWLTEPPDILNGKYHGYKHSVLIGNPKIVERLSNELR